MGWEKIFRANGNQRKAVVAILISDKIDLKKKKRLRDQEGHYKMITCSTQEDIKITNIYMYTQHRSTSKCKANTNKNKGRNQQ